MLRLFLTAISAILFFRPLRSFDADLIVDFNNQLKVVSARKKRQTYKIKFA